MFLWGEVGGSGGGGGNVCNAKALKGRVAVSILRVHTPFYISCHKIPLAVLKWDKAFVYTYVLVADDTVLMVVIGLSKPTK